MSKKAAKEPQHGFPGMRCPFCGNSEDGGVQIIASTGKVECGYCRETIDREIISQVAAQWDALYRWVEAMPFRP